MINENAKRRDIPTSEKLYNQLLAQGLKPSEYTIASLLNAYTHGNTDKFKFILDEMKRLNIKSNIVICTTLIKGYCNLNNIDDAIKVLHSMQEEGIEPNSRTYNSLLRGCIKCGRLQEGEVIYSNMRDAQKDQVTLLLMIKLYCYMLKLAPALEIYNTLDNDAKIRDPKTISILLSSCILFNFKNEAYSIIQTNSMKSSQELEMTKRCLDSGQTFLEMPTMLESGIISKGKIGTLPSFNGSVNLELCSGSGDWIVEKAIKHPDSMWFALEIRFDRVHDIWRKIMMSGLSNLRILHMDASNIQDTFQTRKVDNIFINFPDPPKSAHSQRLVSKKFLKALQDILKPKGSITFLTDDKMYCDLVSKDMQSLSHMYKKGFDNGILRNHIENYGSSFFDDITSAKGRNARYYLKIKRL